MSMMSSCPWCGHTCHMYSQLSHMVTLVTPGHTGHMWSHISHVVSLVTCGHNFDMCQKKKMKEMTKICSHRPYGCAEGKNISVVKIFGQSVVPDSHRRLEIQGMRTLRGHHLERIGCISWWILVLLINHSDNPLKILCAIV